MPLTVDQLAEFRAFAEQLADVAAQCTEHGLGDRYRLHPYLRRVAVIGSSAGSVFSPRDRRDADDCVTAQTKARSDDSLR